MKRHNLYMDININNIDYTSSHHTYITTHHYTTRHHITRHHITRHHITRHHRTLTMRYGSLSASDTRKICVPTLELKWKVR